MLARSATRCVYAASRRFKGTVASVEQEDVTRSEEWDNAKPFSEIPGPRGFPIIGNGLRFLPVVGDLRSHDLYELQRRLRAKYGNIVRLDRAFGQQPWIFLMDPELIEKVHRNEGQYPERHSFPSLDYYTSITRKDLFEGRKFSVVSQGEEWRKYRSSVNPHLMQPRSLKTYIAKMDDICSDFVERIQELKDQNEEMPSDFINEINKWALESIALVSLDTRLDCIKAKGDKLIETQKLINLNKVIFDCIEQLDMRISLWKLFSTPTWRLYVKSLNKFHGMAMDYINAAMDRIKEDSEVDVKDRSIMEKILIDTGDPKFATAVAIDLLLAGTDTTSRAFAMTLYNIAKNPDKQQILYEELRTVLPKSPREPITADMLEKMKYLKACFKESQRLRPGSMINLRSVHRDGYAIGGYRIPKDAVMILCLMDIMNNEKYFPNSDKFIPERWLKGYSGEKHSHVFAYTPFGFGPRNCLGKRYAEQLIEIMLAKIFRHFQLEYNHGDAVFLANIFHKIDSPLRFHVRSRPS